jgi:hypothetical protein
VSFPLTREYPKGACSHNGLPSVTRIGTACQWESGANYNGFAPKAGRSAASPGDVTKVRDVTQFAEGCRRFLQAYLAAAGLSRVSRCFVEEKQHWHIGCICAS